MATSHKSEDVSNLFSLFNREGKSHYREILKKDQVDEAQQRWPVFSQVAVGVNPAHAIVNTEHPAASATDPSRHPQKSGLFKRMSPPSQPLHSDFGRNSAPIADTSSKLFQTKERSKATSGLFNKYRPQNSDVSDVARASQAAGHGTSSAPQMNAPVQQSLQSLFKRLEHGAVREPAPSSGFSKEPATTPYKTSGLSSIFQRYSTGRK